MGDNVNRQAVLSIAFGYLGFPFMLGSIILGTWTYIWTIGVAFKNYGLIGLIGSMMTPIISQTILAISRYNRFGFESKFALYSALFIGCAIIGGIFAQLSKYYEEK